MTGWSAACAADVSFRAQNHIRGLSPPRTPWPPGGATDSSRLPSGGLRTRTSEQPPTSWPFLGTTVPEVSSADAAVALAAKNALVLARTPGRDSCTDRRHLTCDGASAAVVAAVRPSARAETRERRTSGGCPRSGSRGPPFAWTHPRVVLDRTRSVIGCFTVRWVAITPPPRRSAQAAGPPGRQRTPAGSDHAG